MWVFTKDGFLSIVEDRSHPGYLLVRARIKGDIEHLFPDAEVEQTPKHDYLYRVSLPREYVALRLSQVVAEIDYDNFKNNVADKRRTDFYADIWLEMADMQEIFEAPSRG